MSRENKKGHRLPPALREKDFALLWVASLTMGLGSQMAAVAVGWQVFAIRHSPLDLGLIGLAEFVPLPLLALPAGHLADRLPRRLVFAAAVAIDRIVISATICIRRSVKSPPPVRSTDSPPAAGAAPVVAVTIALAAGEAA